MTCKQCSSLLIDYVEGLLSPPEQDTIEKHLEECARCRKELKELEITFELLRKDNIAPLSRAKKTALFPLVMERVEQKKNIKARRKRWSYVFSFVSAMILIFLISIVVINKRKETGIYTVFTYPANIIYKNDSLIDNYVLESIVETDTIINDIRTDLDDELVENAQLTSLVEQLSEDEVNELVRKLRTIEFNGG